MKKYKIKIKDRIANFFGYERITAPVVLYQQECFSLTPSFISFKGQMPPCRWLNDKIGLSTAKQKTRHDLKQEIFKIIEPKILFTEYEDPATGNIIIEATFEMYERSNR